MDKQILSKNVEYNQHRKMNGIHFYKKKRNTNCCMGLFCQEMYLIYRLNSSSNRLNSSSNRLNSSSNIYFENMDFCLRLSP